jgi:lysophospholipase L1-like esterase
MWRNFLWALVFLFSMGVCTHAQVVEQYNPPPSRCCLATTAKGLADATQDWNQMGRYYAADQELEKESADPKRVVFMGDSITDFWHLADSFPGKPYVDRGISGQVTAQMLSRMYQDVIDLKPAAVVILAGTNDIAQNNGPETATMIKENLMAMTELAQKHGIKVILCSITPINDYTMVPVGGGFPGALPPGSAPAKRIQSVQRPPADILKLNAWMKDYATSVGAVYADYFSAVVDPNGMFKEGYSNDGLHPNAQGYGLMAPVAEASIEKALR